MSQIYEIVKTGYRRWAPAVLEWLLKTAPIVISLCALGISWGTYMMNSRPKHIATHAIALGVGRCAEPRSTEFYIDIALVNTGDIDATISHLGVGLPDKTPVQEGGVMMFSQRVDTHAKLPDCGAALPTIKPFLLRAGEIVTERLFAGIKGVPSTLKGTPDQIVMYPEVKYCRLTRGFIGYQQQPLGTLVFDKKDLSLVALSHLLSNPRMYVESKEDSSCSVSINESFQMISVYGPQK
jgi:hypothetical protein